MKTISLKTYIILGIFLFSWAMVDTSGIAQLCFFELFLTYFASTTLIEPLAIIIGKDMESVNKIYKRLIYLRLLFILIFIKYYSFIIAFDFLTIIVGSIILVPISKKKKIKLHSLETGIDISNVNNVNNNSNTNLTLQPNLEKCVKCGAPLSSNVCEYCGSVNEKVVVNSDVISIGKGTSFNPMEYPLYGMSVNDALTELINNELKNNNVDNKISIPKLEIRRTIFSIIYCLILFLCISMIFFHSHNVVACIVIIVSSIIYFGIFRKYDIVNYIMKELKSRPDEKISYVVSSIASGKKSNFVYKVLRVCLIVFVIICPLVIFRKPMIIYERQGDDYVVRFYTIGAFKNDSKLVIPSKYKNRDVVGIRGDVFANVKTIKEVVLPDTIKEIRGGAFYNASNLEKINLPEGITEVKGNTFERCKRLKSIDIPDGVVRIGGSAFRDCYSLEKVNIPASVKEIGSSAFRSTNLKSVCMSINADVDIRAFKNTNTKIYYYENGCMEALYYE